MAKSQPLNIPGVLHDFHSDQKVPGILKVGQPHSDLKHGDLPALGISHTDGSLMEAVFSPNSPVAIDKGGKLIFSGREMSSKNLVLGLKMEHLKTPEVLKILTEVQSRLTKDPLFMFGSSALEILREELPKLAQHSSQQVQRKAAAISHILERESGESFSA